MEIDPDYTRPGDAIAWVCGGSGLAFAGVSCIAAYVEGAHLYVAGFLACCALILYALLQRSLIDKPEVKK